MQLFKISMAIMVTLVFLSSESMASTFFKCTDKSFVHVGDSKGKVRALCGEPVYIDKNSGDGAESINESWTYNNTSGQGWMTSLHFENGLLVSIESLGRVK